ncbi:hypothetical protein SAMN02910293_02037 [Streptococcus henryi]|uniref:Uncharacterized protein n=1 Tax=Streptococcus henryi TaxID=439219 RepID=A0A1G6D8B7_9STRE|nr:hypothetical protein [Streptococcus henryi]SDB41368.1 hypothetical protein SAMN02910293_02037 [Streptococcus henryi]
MKLKTNTLNIPSGFGSASGTIFHKQIFFIDFDDKLPYSFWEITYSPSMGTDSGKLEKNLLKYMASMHTSDPIIINHISWRNFLISKSNVIKKKIRLSGIEFDLTKQTTFIPKVDFLRIKAYKNVPKWIFSLVTMPQILIIDYNNSSDLSNLSKDLAQIQSTFPDIKVYLEQPFESFENCRNRPEFEKCHLIFDSYNYINKIKNNYIDKGDIFNFKIGRNTVKEYEYLIKNNYNIIFGNVTSSKIGQEICNKLSDRFANVELNCIEIKN